MASEAHLLILERGVAAWNQWRSENPLLRPDLRGADLPGAHLSGTDLSGADLRGTNLTGADLSGGDLRRTDFSGADLVASQLSEADLRVANLRWAHLSAAHLPQANLREAILIGTQLIGADLREADLREADLSGAYLSAACLRGADLRRTRLSKAHLDRVDLSEANLSEAILSGAQVREADLTGTDLRDAYLNGADLSQCTMRLTTLGNNDLSTVKGLETVNHSGPSTIGIDTIYRSKANIPERFLRGVGVPDEFITYMKSLVVRPFEYYSCFISYSSKDVDFARRLYADLSREHVRCWFAPEDVKIGEKFRTRIDEAIRVYDKLLVILSQNSIESPWVEDEVEAALEKERQRSTLVLFPIRLDEAVMTARQAWAAKIRRIVHMGDFSKWKDHDNYKETFARLLRDLTADHKASS